MIKEFKTYIPECDGCGKEAKAQSYMEDVLEQMDHDEWYQVGNKHYCPKCQYYDEDVLYVRIRK